MPQRINKQIRAITAIKPKLHFLQVGRKMLCRNLMPRADHAAFQERERGFNRIRVNVALHVDFQFVPDGLVATVFPQFAGRALVGVVIVREKHVHVLADILLDEFAKRKRECRPAKSSARSE